MYEYYVVYVQYCGMVHAVAGCGTTGSTCTVQYSTVQHSAVQYSSIWESRPVRTCAKFDATHHVNDVMQ